MLRKNQFLLMPHVPGRDKSDPSTATAGSNNETSETSDLNVDARDTMNQNFLMESRNDESHRLAMMNENDENYFEIFKTPMKFGTENNTEVTAQIGTTAHLPCTIHSIGEGVVSCKRSFLFAVCLWPDMHSCPNMKRSLTLHVANNLKLLFRSRGSVGKIIIC